MTITIGRFNIPGVLIAGIISYLIVLIISIFIFKDKKSRKTTLETISNILFIGFFTWKLSPIITSFSWEHPFGFLFLPGGTLGLWIALFTSIIYLSITIIRTYDKKRLFLGILFIVIAGINLTFLSNLNSKSLNMENIKNITDLGFDIENGKPTLINFWATWCAPCKSEIPELNEFYKEHNQDINFYGVNMSSTEKGSIEKFIKDYNMIFPIILDSTTDISKYFEIKSIPTTVIITNKGGSYYIDKYSGAVTKDVLESAIK